MWIDLALVAVGGFAMLLSFFNETWKDRERGFSRITRFGWITLTFMVATLVLGVVKQFNDSKRDVELDHARLELKTAQDRLDARGKASDILQKVSNCELLAFPSPIPSGVRSEDWKRLREVQGRGIASWDRVFKGTELDFECPISR